ncbi:MAG TPA: glycosyltransferase family 4 protein [Azospirillum sp.]|nr:glycosyltransferase family 4 protein [Azospirillum sp.]
MRLTLFRMDVPRGAMTVLHVYAYFRPDYTGDGIYFERLIHHLWNGAMGHEVLATRTRRDGGSAGEASVPVTLADLPVHYLGGTPGRTGLFGLLWWLLRHGRRYRVVHLHAHVDRTFLSYLLMRLLGCRIVLSSTLDDGPVDIVASYRRHKRPLVRGLLHLIDAFVAISPKLHHENRPVVPGARLRLIPQGVEPHHPRLDRGAVRRLMGIDDGAFVLLALTSFIPRKDPLFLVECMPRLIAAVPGCMLVLVGPILAPDYAEAVRARVRLLGLERHVLLRGFDPEPDLLYEMSDVFVSASRDEGFGNTLLEAMAAGRPVVARHLPGVNDYFIEHAASGFLIHDADAYVETVVRLARDPELRRRVGQTARARADERFAMARIAARYRELYERVGLPAASAGALRPANPDSADGPSGLSGLPGNLPSASLPGRNAGP